MSSEMHSSNTLAAAASSGLKYPLRLTALRKAFEALSPENIRRFEQPGLHEALVDGAWPLSRLRKHFRMLGFQQTGPKENLAFVNEQQTVGIILFGVEPHPEKNTWTRYGFEVQARTAAAAKRAVATTATKASNLFNL